MIESEKNLESFSHDPEGDDENKDFAITDAGMANWAVEKIKENQLALKKAAEKRAEVIQSAEKIYEEDTKEINKNLDYFCGKLRPYAENNLIGKKRSIKLPAGVMKFSKQPNLFFFNGEKADSKSKKLLEWCKENRPEFVKEKKSYLVDWDALKKILVVVDSDSGELCQVCTDDGELIKEMTCEIQKDKFSVITEVEENGYYR